MIVTCSLTPVSSSTLRTCAGGDSSVSGAVVAEPLAHRDQHADPRGVEEVEAAAVEQDPRRSSIDDPVQRVAELGAVAMSISPRTTTHRTVVGRTRFEFQIGHAVHLLAR